MPAPLIIPRRCNANHPLKYRLGRGVLSSLGIDFDLQEGDVAARANFATMDDGGKISDRRAGRIATDLNQCLCQKIRNKVKLDFDHKVELIEAVDRLIPQVTALNPDVLVVTADHSTPAIMGRHSWHPVPVMLAAATAKIDPVSSFDEYACIHGSLGTRPGTHLMGLALANAGRLKKFGA